MSCAWRQCHVNRICCLFGLLLCVDWSSKQEAKQALTFFSTKAEERKKEGRRERPVFRIARSPCHHDCKLLLCDLIESQVSIIMDCKNFRVLSSLAMCVSTVQSCFTVGYLKDKAQSIAMCNSRINSDCRLNYPIQICHWEGSIWRTEVQTDLPMGAKVRPWSRMNTGIGGDPVRIRFGSVKPNLRFCAHYYV